MKGPLVASGVAVVLAVMAVYRLVNPIPAGEHVIARATIEQIASSVVIPRGMRALAVPVNGVVGVRRLVFPGMRADVLISGTLPSGSEGPGIHTRTLLRNIEVLSAGQDFKRDAEGKPLAAQVFNLLVTRNRPSSLASQATSPLSNWHCAIRSTLRFRRRRLKLDSRLSARHLVWCEMWR